MYLTIKPLKSSTIRVCLSSLQARMSRPLGAIDNRFHLREPYTSTTM